MKKCFEKHKLYIYARLVLPFVIILASDGLLVSVTRILVCKNGPPAMWLGPQGLSWSGSASVWVDLGFQVQTCWQGLPIQPSPYQTCLTGIFEAVT